MRSVVHVLVAILVLTATARLASAGSYALGQADAGTAAFQGGNVEQAIAAFTEAIRAQGLPDDQLAMTYHNRGLAYHAAGEAGYAVLDYSMALTRGMPADVRPRTLNNRGLAYEALGDFDAALNDFTSAITANPAYAEPYSNRGNLLRKRKQFAQAVADCEKSLKLRHPRPVQPLLTIGLALEGLGQGAKAVAYYREALRIEPAFEAAQTRLAVLDPSRIPPMGPDAMESVTPQSDAASASSAFGGAPIVAMKSEPITPSSAVVPVPQVPATARAPEPAKRRVVIVEAPAPQRPVVKSAGGPEAQEPSDVGAQAPTIPAAQNTLAPVATPPVLSDRQTVLASANPAAAVASPAGAVAPPSAIVAAAPAAAPIAGPATAPVLSEGFRLQIGSFVSMEQAAKGWEALKTNPVLETVKPRILEVDHPKKGRIFRLYAIELASRDTATALCRSVLGAGATCLISQN